MNADRAGSRCTSLASISPASKTTKKSTFYSHRMIYSTAEQAGESNCTTVRFFDLENEFLLFYHGALEKSGTDLRAIIRVQKEKQTVA